MRQGPGRFRRDTGNFALHTGTGGTKTCNHSTSIQLRGSQPSAPSLEPRCVRRKMIHLFCKINQVDMSTVTSALQNKPSWHVHCKQHDRHQSHNCTSSNEKLLKFQTVLLHQTVVCKKAKLLPHKQVENEQHEIQISPFTFWDNTLSKFWSLAYLTSSGLLIWALDFMKVKRHIYI